jgi:hypothetical protein
MAFLLTFKPKGMTIASYDAVIRKLAQAGAGAPKGRLHHVCAEKDGELRIIDVWESMEDVQAFGATLLPILAEHGIDGGQPEVATAHNVIRG